MPLVLLLCAVHSLPNLPISRENALLNRLVGEYRERGIYGLPRRDPRDILHVSLGLSLVQIVDLNELEGTLTTSVWLTLAWRDDYLRWSPADYDNITNVRLKIGMIWSPDVVLYNTADDRLDEKRDALATVEHDGQVTWTPQSLFKSLCNFEVKYFPFDVQNCSMIFGPWTYDSAKLQLDFYRAIPQVLLGNYVTSNEWNIISHDGFKNSKNYSCCSGVDYNLLNFSIRLRRKVLFHFFTLVVPCLLLSLLTLVSFWIPPWSPAKIIIGVNVFLAFILLLLLLAKSIPKSTVIPIIGELFGVTMSMIAISTLFAIYISNIYVTKTAPISPLLRKILFSFLAPALLMRDEVDVPQQPRGRRRKQVDLLVSSDFDQGIRNIRDYVEFLWEKLHQKSAASRTITERKFCALVIDRLFFVCYLLSFLIIISVQLTKMSILYR